MPPNELDDLHRDPGLPLGWLDLDRDARLFATRRELAARLEREREQRPLIGDELLHPPVPCDLVVRFGNLRISELLPDGREVTRAVLQAGAVCRTREDAGESPAGPIYRLRDLVLMALGETEIWILPAGAVADED
jgi:hypothetical protein